MGQFESVDIDPHDFANVPEAELELHPMSYVNCGLAHSMEEFDLAWPAIVNYSIAQQMEYADAITRRYSLNPHFIYKQHLSLLTKTPSAWAQFIETRGDSSAVGNLAYMLYYNPPETEIGRRIEKILTELKKLILYCFHCTAVGTFL